MCVHVKAGACFHGCGTHVMACGAHVVACGVQVFAPRLYVRSCPALVNS
jgi:hypothetical protein